MIYIYIYIYICTASAWSLYSFFGQGQGFECCSLYCFGRRETNK